jgi:hypothetical protein
VISTGFGPPYHDETMTALIETVKPMVVGASAPA